MVRFPASFRTRGAVTSVLGRASSRLFSFRFVGLMRDRSTALPEPFSNVRREGKLRMDDPAPVSRLDGR
jgi:hypothetical protein